MNQDNFVTPPEIYNKLLKIWKLQEIDIDVCATNLNKKCDMYFSEELNSLNINWGTKGKSICFCNPPHSKTKDFVLKGFREWNYRGIQTVFLIPLNCLSANYIHEQQYFKDKLGYKHYDNKAIIDFNIIPLQGRIRFLNEDLTPSKYLSRNGYCTFFISETNYKKIC